MARAITVATYPAPTRLAASAQVSAVPVVLIAFLIVGGTANTQLEIKDALTDTGDAAVEGKALIQDSKFYDFAPLGGVPFDTGMFAVLTGAGGVVYIWTEK